MVLNPESILSTNSDDHEDGRHGFMVKIPRYSCDEEHIDPNLRCEICDIIPNAMVIKPTDLSDETRALLREANQREKQKLQRTWSATRDAAKPLPPIPDEDSSSPSGSITSDDYRMIADNDIESGQELLQSLIPRRSLFDRLAIGSDGSISSSAVEEVGLYQRLYSEDEDEDDEKLSRYQSASSSISSGSIITASAVQIRCISKNDIAIINNKNSANQEKGQDENKPPEIKGHRRSTFVLAIPGAKLQDIKKPVPNAPAPSVNQQPTPKKTVRFAAPEARHEPIPSSRKVYRPEVHGAGGFGAYRIKPKPSTEENRLRVPQRPTYDTNRARFHTERVPPSPTASITPSISSSMESPTHSDFPSSSNSVDTRKVSGVKKLFHKMGRNPKGDKDDKDT